MICDDNDDDGFELKDTRTIEEIPDDEWDKLMREYDPDEIESYLKRDNELRSMDIETFVHFDRIENYGLTDDEMDSGDQD